MRLGDGPLKFLKSSNTVVAAVVVPLVEAEDRVVGLVVARFFI